MRSCLHTAALALALCAAMASSSQSPVQPPPSAETMPWPQRLGQRVVALQQSAPVQDRVVLVPDEATFLDELARWSPDGRWPILIEDGVYSPMFIRAFAPKQVVRRTQPAAGPADEAALRQAVDAAVTRAFGGDPAKQGPAQAMQARQITPLGLAAYSTHDPAFVAAAALAAGRGLVPVALEGNFGVPNGQLDPAAFASLDRAVTDAFAATQLPFAQMGDALEALVICRDVAHATSLDLSLAKVPSAQGMPPIKPGEPFAVTDALCRTPSGARWAVCSAIFGSSARSAFAAMSSLFLQRGSVWAIDSYGGAEKWLDAFHVDGLDKGLRNAGFDELVRSGEQADLRAWRDLLGKGFTCDVLFLNSSGNADFFDLGTPGKTPASSCGAPGDVPVLVKPLALAMVHSFSLQQPADRETIGGRWLDTGVYAYAGSVHEPYLFAFVPPVACLEKLVNGVPFGVAARIWDGPFSLPWRVTLYGDPLMPCVAPKGLPPAPRVPGMPVVPGEMDVVAHCRELLGRCKDDAKGDATLAAMRELAAGGQDRLAVQLWKISATRPWAARVAPAALESLHAQRDADGFLKAYGLTADPTPRQRDMLWQLCGPMLDSLRDRDALLLFEMAVRPTWPSKDIERLVPALQAAFGPEHLRALVVRVQKATRSPQQQAALEALLKGL